MLLVSALGVVICEYKIEFYHVGLSTILSFSPISSPLPHFCRPLLSRLESICSIYFFFSPSFPLFYSRARLCLFVFACQYGRQRSAFVYLPFTSNIPPLLHTGPLQRNVLINLSIQPGKGKYSLSTSCPLHLCQ